MDFTTLHDTIPLARFGKEKVLEMSPYPNIVLAMPGRHAEDTTPKGGDFVVMVTDKFINWKKHQFKHDDIFNDIELRTAAGAADMQKYMVYYFDIVFHRKDPSNAPFTHVLGTISPQTFFYAIQCLAVAEHRRYAKHEDKGGGRFLPFRFSAGIAEGLWTAQDAIDVQRYGRPAVERLEKKKGVPALTQKLLDEL